MKEKYIGLMERSLSAYTDEHILRYFGDVKENGLTEHGFPRLTSNIGILISHGIRRDLLPLFTEMMEFCCKTIPRVKAANDFSVREIIGCLIEVEASGILPGEVTERWRGYLRGIDPTSCYTCFATSPDGDEKNWALFTAVSEYFRQEAGLCDSGEFVELQLSQQLKWMDENGMYMDARSDIHHPMTYDLAPRGLFSLLLDRGYNGKHRDRIDAYLKQAGLLTLGMQSPCGEIPFGGRSNQFILCEGWMITAYEYEIKRYEREGNRALADAFRAAVAGAVGAMEEWLDKVPIRHIRNRYPTETGYGCERYAYFDKYMITVASNIYAAYLICGSSEPYTASPDLKPSVTLTSDHFHKLFIGGGGYGLEFDLNADPHYDANGLGRVHRRGAPSTVCMSTPCAAEPKYTVDIESPFALSLCSAVYSEDGYISGAEEDTEYRVICSGCEGDSAFAELLLTFRNNATVKESYRVNGEGVSVTAQGEGRVAFALPAFSFDGENTTVIKAEKNTLTVAYGGWICRYITDGEIIDTGRIAANRNGHYREYLATGENTVNVKIEIVKE